ncbi:lipopolysaccharide transport periplasmic protein LptA [Pseudidiomarina aestuarii]|uniref:Lipopolysaccharide export system protein LptA n=2 Tax=Pseudidiomarina aestuarii TaxID=624146 RepID=A0A7Z6ZV31_9GAMM|nr:lipopolysaccharide transport periplasmic protein LptA [Pseudidiomarina aestuarii]
MAKTLSCVEKAWLLIYAPKCWNLKNMLKAPILVTTLLLLSSIGLTAVAVAQGKADFNQPVSIDAERDLIDIANRIATFDENVLIKQGTLEIRADHLQVTREAEPGNDVFEATGTPATYEQQLDDGSVITAQAETIRYDQAQQLLTLRGNVKVEQNNSVMQGNEIVYNFATQQLSARRGDEESDRVSTILLPKQKNDEPINR